jgi:hypothetical protein
MHLREHSISSRAQCTITSSHPLKLHDYMYIVGSGEQIHLPEPGVDVQDKTLLSTIEALLSVPLMPCCHDFS